MSVCSVQDKEKKKKESIFDLSKYIDKPIRVKFQGGREGKSTSPEDSKLPSMLTELALSKSDFASFGYCCGLPG